MSFLAPLFLIGAGAIVLPVAFHLIRRSPRTRQVFSSLMFLKPSPPRFSRRSRLEHLLLLLLRCAVLCLLAAAFARPFLNKPFTPASIPDSAGRYVVLIDTSASMQRDGLWEGALDRLKDLLSNREPLDEVAVLTFDRSVQSIVTFEEWRAEPAANRSSMANTRLEAVHPTWARTDVDQAVIQAAEMLATAEEAGDRTDHKILLLTDLQEGSRTRGLQGYDWPEGVSLNTIQLLPSATDNASLEWLSNTASGKELVVRLRVSNAADSRKEQFKVGWSASTREGFIGTPVEVYVPAGQSRIVSLSPIDMPTTEARIRIEGDAETFDNEAFVIPPSQLHLNIAYFGPETSDDRSQPLYFLERAFQDTPTRTISVVHVDGKTPLQPSEVNDCALVVVTTLTGENHKVAVRKALEKGATVLFAPRDANAASALATLIGMDQVTSTDQSLPDYALLAHVDFRHPLFEPFADARFSDFTGIHFWNYRKLDPTLLPNARVIAAFDTDDPALIEVPVGAGRLLVLTSLWHPDDSQLALSSKFVPLLFSLLEMTGKGGGLITRLTVGDPILVPAQMEGAQKATLLTPEGDRVEWNADRPAPTASRPGHYLLETEAGSTALVANLDPAEARTSPLPPDELERLGSPVTVEPPSVVLAPEQQAKLHRDELETQQKLWRWIIVLTLGVLLVETWLAGWTTRHPRTTERAAA